MRKNLRFPTLEKLMASLGFEIDDEFELDEIGNSYYNNFMRFEIPRSVDGSIEFESYELTASDDSLMLTSENGDVEITDSNTCQAFVDVFKEYYRSIPKLTQVSTFFDVACPVMDYLDANADVEVKFKVDADELRDRTRGLVANEEVTYFTSLDQKCVVWTDVSDIGMWDLTAEDIQESFDEHLAEITECSVDVAQVIIETDNELQVIFVYLASDYELDHIQSFDHMHLTQDRVGGVLFEFKKG